MYVNRSIFHIAPDVPLILWRSKMHCYYSLKHLFDTLRNNILTGILTKSFKNHTYAVNTHNIKHSHHQLFLCILQRLQQQQRLRLVTRTYNKRREMKLLCPLRNNVKKNVFSGCGDVKDNHYLCFVC